MIAIDARHLWVGRGCRRHVLPLPLEAVSHVAWREWLRRGLLTVNDRNAITSIVRHRKWHGRPHLVLTAINHQYQLVLRFRMHSPSYAARKKANLHTRVPLKPATLQQQTPQRALVENFEPLT